MQLKLPVEYLEGYTSGSQRARVVTEPWAEANLYCPSCTSPRLVPFNANTPAKDFRCPECNELFQLKSQKRPFTTRINDSAYSKMCQAIRMDATPSFFALHYHPEKWRVQSLILVPRFVVSLSAVEKRNPLSPTAERSAWVGCNILLAGIPVDARISVVMNGVAARPSTVREHFNRLRRFENLRVEKRGWTLDVLRIVQGLDNEGFHLDDVYAHGAALAKLHPGNKHINDKIRQQLQELSKLGYVNRVRPGYYRVL